MRLLSILGVLVVFILVGSAPGFIHTNNHGIEIGQEPEIPDFSKMINAELYVQSNSIYLTISIDERLEKAISRFSYELSGIHGELISATREVFDISNIQQYDTVIGIDPEWPRHIRVDKIFIIPHSVDKIVLEYDKAEFSSNNVDLGTSWDNSIRDTTTSKLLDVNVSSTSINHSDYVYFGLSFSDSSGIMIDVYELYFKERYEIKTVFESETGEKRDRYSTIEQLIVEGDRTNFSVIPHIDQWFGNSMTLEYIRISDKSGNIAEFWEGVDFSSPIVSISGSTPDTEAPVIENIRYSKSELSYMQKFNVSLTVSDDMSGVDPDQIAVYFRFNNTNLWASSSMVIDLNNGTYVQTYILNKKFAPGSFYVQEIIVGDYAGHKNTYISGQNLTRVNITANVAYDITPPTLQSISYSNNLYLDNLKINIIANDSQDQPYLAVVFIMIINSSGEKFKIPTSQSDLGQVDIVPFYDDSNSTIVQINLLKMILDYNAIAVYIDMIWILDEATNGANYSNRTNLPEIEGMELRSFTPLTIPIEFPDDLYRIDTTTTTSKTSSNNEETSSNTQITDPITSAITDPVNTNLFVPFPSIGLFILVIPVVYQKLKKHSNY